MNGTRILRAAPAVVALVVLLVLPQTVSDFRLNQMTGWIPLALAALGLNLLTGYNGQISVGHGALYGVGAYTAGLLVTRGQWPLLAAVAGAGVVTFVVGLVIGLPALRIKGLYLALVTLAVAVLFPDVVKRFSSLTGGAKGLYLTTPELNSRGVVVDKPVKLLPPGGIDQTREQWTFYVFVVVAAVMFLLVRNLVNSRSGRAIVAVRDNEIAAEVNGIDVARVKVLTFGVSAGLAGVAGGLFAVWQGQIFPQSFVVTTSLYLLVAVVVGGPASIMGPAIGALFVGLFQDVITPELPERFSKATPLILGVGLIVLMLVAPGGIAGLARQLVARVQGSRGSVPRPDPSMETPTIGSAPPS